MQVLSHKCVYTDTNIASNRKQQAYSLAPNTMAESIAKTAYKTWLPRT